ncbi:MAG TPA: phosphatase PAP2 family protein [Polyangia bacterium]|jgi:membrane-associated phospholipid phosphatase
MTAPVDDRTTAFYRWTRGLGMGAVQSLVYFGIGHATFPRSTELLRTRLDDAIPFWPWTSWFYLPFYAGIFIICIVSFRSRRLFNRGLLSVVMVMIVGAVCHLLIRAEYPRPILHPPYPDLSAAFMAWVQRVDRPGNVFPSLHVAQTSTLAFLLCRDRPRLGVVTVVMGALLALSTLTTKQHFIVDVISGYALAFAARALALYKLPRPAAPAVTPPPA